jgi:spore coat polysaccharide biosynthesis predicted glycosyltransferase SpsG
MTQLMKDSDQAIMALGGALGELLSMGWAVLSYSRNMVQASLGAGFVASQGGGGRG